ncbi:MAG TPA: GspMb/PilO family protein [Ramlibacter sp.]|uniref:GspMb/PilO family protein n=1 Tax=Ramlibacter sp. TaxID=1917967 RepID=UPI002ED1BAB7
MSRVRAWLAHAARHADPVTAAAVTLLALAAILHWGASATLRDRITESRQGVADAHRQALDAGRERQRREAMSPAARAEAFYRFFPAEASATDALVRIHDAAARHGVQLAQADYRMTRTEGTRLLAYQVTYPVKGSYSQLRKFLTQVLREVPNASLDDVNFRRDAISQAEVQATLKLTLHLKEGP